MWVLQWIGKRGCRNPKEISAAFLKARRCISPKAATSAASLFESQAPPRYSIRKAALMLRLSYMNAERDAKKYKTYFGFKNNQGTQQGQWKALWHLLGHWQWSNHQWANLPATPKVEECVIWRILKYFKPSGCRKEWLGFGKFAITTSGHQECCCGTLLPPTFWPIQRSLAAQSLLAQLGEVRPFLRKALRETKNCVWKALIGSVTLESARHIKKTAAKNLYGLCNIGAIFGSWLPIGHQHPFAHQLARKPWAPPSCSRQSTFQPQGANYGRHLAWS